MPPRPPASPSVPTATLIRRLLVFIMTTIGMLVILGLLATLVMFAFGIRPSFTKEAKQEPTKLPPPLIERRVLHGPPPQK